MPASPAPISSGTGDIVLASGKKSSKGLIIALIVAVVLIVGAVVAFLMLRGGTGLNVSGDAGVAFSRYANYLLYGEESDESLEGEHNDESPARIYAILDEEPNVRTAYARKLKSYWDDFYDKASKFELANGVTSGDYNARVDFTVRYLLDSSELSDETVLASMQTGTSEQANQKIEDYFAKYTRYNFEDARNYVTMGQDYYRGLVNLVQNAKEAGCDLYSENETVCDEDDIIGDDEDYGEIDEKFAEMEGAVDNVAQYLVSNSWEIKASLDGSKK